MIKIESKGNKLVVKGNIKSVEHYNDIKNNIDQIIRNQEHIIVELVDSISLTSSVIGYFTKIVNIDKINLKLYVNDEKLFELLDDLGLLQMLNVQKVYMKVKF